MTTEQTLANSLGIELAIKQIPIGAHKINYLVAGKGEPLLLIHGANFGWGVWYPNIPELAKHFTVYAIDLPGAGHSSTSALQRYGCYLFCRIGFVMCLSCSFLALKNR